MFTLVDKLSVLIAPIFYKLLFMSVSALIVALIVIAIRKAFDARISPFWKYAMWFLVLVALVVPYRPTSDIALTKNVQQIEDVSFRAQYDQVSIAVKSARQALAEDVNINSVNASGAVADLLEKQETLRQKSLVFDVVLPLVWLVGIIVATIYLTLQRSRLINSLRAGADSKSNRFQQILADCKRRFEVRRKIDLRLSGELSSPAIIGAFKPTIILPNYAQQMSNQSLQYVISHELGHFKRRDLLLSDLMLAIGVIYWFNPLLWFVFKLIRDDMEVLNDQYVIAKIGVENSNYYAQSLVEVLAHANGIALLPRLMSMADGKKNIARRINMIKLGEKFKKHKITIATISLVLMAVIASLFLTSAKAEHSIAIYVMPGIEIPGDENTIEDYSQYIADNEPVLTEADITGYNAELRMFFLREEILKAYRQKKAALSDKEKLSLSGSLILGADGPAAFIVALDGEVVYGGNTEVSLVSSYAPRGPIIRDCDFGLRITRDIFLRENPQIADEALVEAFKDMGLLTENIFDVSAPASSAYYDVKKLFNHRTEYVGDSSKVVNIASSLAYPDGSTYDSVVLHTDARPYGIEVHLNVDAAGKEDEFYQARFIAFRERAELLFALIGNLDRVDFVLNGKRDIKRTCFVEEAAHFRYSLKWRDALPADYGLIADPYDSTATLIDAYDFIEDSSSYYFEYDPDEANQPKDEDDKPIEVDE